MSEGAPSLDRVGRWLTDEGVRVLDGILGAALDVVGVLDPNLTLRYVNWTAPGLTRANIVGNSVLDLVPPGFKESSREAYLGVLRTGIGTRFETIYRDEKGVLIWAVQVAPIHQESEVIGLITIATDVTEQRSELVDRERFFSLSLDMLVVVTNDGRLKRINPAFAETLHIEPEELIDRPFIELVHESDRAMTLASFDEVRRGVHVDDFENRYRRSDGKYRVFSWRANMDPVTGDVYAVARDITEQREAENQLRHAQKMEAVGQLAGGVAHDFNNLMQAVLANVELALATDSPSSVVDHLHEIAGAGRRAADLTRQLLMFGRRQPLRRELLDLRELLTGLMTLLRRLLPESVAIQLRSGDPLPAVSADRTQLEQVVVNLCVNARDAMPRGGALTMEVESVVIDERDCELHPWARPGHFVRLSVTDTGEGMSPELRDRVFEPFFTTKDNQRGTGLGLATVYGIVQRHGGLVHVYSEVGQGATFKIYLPADERSVKPIAALAPDSHRAPVRGREVILVAEDEAAVSRPLVQMLERAGYGTLSASNGLEAVRLLQEHADIVDLALLDVVMPELGGPQAWERMRHIRPDLCVVFASGYADDRYRDQLPRDAEVLEKPFRRDEVLAAICRTLETCSSE